MSDTSSTGDVAPVADPTITTEPIPTTAPADPIAPPAPEVPADPVQTAIGDLTKIVGDKSATTECEKAVAAAEAEEAIAQAALDAAKAKTIDARAVLAVAIKAENADVDTAVADVAKLHHA